MRSNLIRLSLSALIFCSLLSAACVAKKKAKAIDSFATVEFSYCQTDDPKTTEDERSKVEWGKSAQGKVARRITYLDGRAPRVDIDSGMPSVHDLALERDYNREKAASEGK